MIISKNRKLKIPRGEGRFLLAAQGQQSVIHLLCLPSFSHFCLSLEFWEWWHCFCKFEKALGLFWLVECTLIICVSMKRWGCTFQGLQAWHLHIAEILLQHLYQPHEIINSWKPGLCLSFLLLYPQWLEPCPCLIITPQILVEWMIMQ